MRAGRASGTATVLFTDLVGSTELMSRVGAAAHGAALTYCAAVCSHLGDRAAAALLREQITPFAAQVPTPGGGIVNGAFAHYLGLLATTLGEWDEAEGHFGAALDTHERLGAPVLLARTRVEWARMLRIRRQPGDADRARELLGTALATARELDLAGVERQAVALL